MHYDIFEHENLGTETGIRLKYSDDTYPGWLVSPNFGIIPPNGTSETVLGTR